MFAPTIGLIAEYNPFHNGHVYQLAKLRELHPDAAIVVIMSGSFTQRGGAAIADKWTRAAWAVQDGTDLVLELPYAFACRSAEHFATGGVQSLAALGCVEALAFGAEAESIETLEKAAACMDDVALQDALHERIQKGASYATAMSAEVAERTGVAPEVLRAPNNILGIEYLRAVRKFAPEMEAIIIDGTTAERRELLRQLTMHDVAKLAAFEMIAQINITVLVNRAAHRIVQGEVHRISLFILHFRISCQIGIVAKKHGVGNIH